MRLFRYFIALLTALILITTTAFISWDTFPAMPMPTALTALEPDSSMQVTSICGTRDGLASVDEALASAELLPAQCAFVPLAFGNHAQFGWYGTQNGDFEATISR
jgi:hypothetical protein